MVIALSSLAALAAAFLWGFLVYKSEIYRAESVRLAQEIADASIESQRNVSLKTSLGRAKDSVADILDDFTLESRIPDFISSLERSARDSSVSLEIGSLSLGGSSEDASPRPLTLRLNGSCSWKDCVSFVAGLDAMHSALEIKEVAFSTEGKGVWRFSVDMIQFVIK